MRRAIAGIPQGRPRSWEGRAEGRMPVSPVVATAMGALSVYKRFVSPLLPAACRFQPTCSEYGYAALSRYGLFRGSLLTLKRLLRCHPFHPGGFDPP